MPDGKLRLDDQLCFALYAATNAITRSYRPRLDRIGLTYPQYLVLLTLWQDGSQTIRAIADRLHLPPNAITPLLDRLETAGFLVRRRDGKDRRAVHIHLTPRGIALEAQAAAAQSEVECATELNPQALAALRDELHALTARVEANDAVEDR